MAIIQVELRDAADLFRAMGSRAPAAIHRGLLSAAMQAKPIMVRQTDTAPPASRRGSRGAVNTGNYRQAWKAAPDSKGGSQGLLVANTSPYAGVIEYGRRRGAKAPPLEPIARWAQRKLGLPYKRARGIAFVIARRISQRGLLARRVLTSRTTTDLLLTAVKRNVLREIIRTLRSP